MKEYEKPSLNLVVFEEDFNVFLNTSIGTDNDNDGSDIGDWFV